MKRSILVFLSVWLLALVMSWAGRGWEYRIYDSLCRLSAPSIDSPVILVEIDQASLDFYQRNHDLSWPFPRSLYAKAISFLQSRKVAAVGIDLVFSEADAYAGEDEQLAQAMNQARNVVLPLFFSQNTTAEAELRRFSLPAHMGLTAPVRPGVYGPLPLFLPCLAAAGDAIFEPDSDGVYRRLRQTVRYRDRAYPSFALALASLKDPQKKIPDWALDEFGLRFYRPDSWPRISIMHLVQAEMRRQAGLDAGPQVQAMDFQGKIVIIGATALGLLDQRPNPVNPKAGGIEMHANAVVNLLRGEGIRPLPATWQWLLWALLCLTSQLSIRRLRHFYAMAAWVGGLLLLGAGLQIWLFQRQWQIALLPLTICVLIPGTTNILWRFQQERKKRRLVQNAFQNYLSQDLLEMIKKNPDQLKLGGEQKEITIFFSDLAGFTSMSESLSPQAVVEILNQYFERMNRIIRAHSGYINKFVGDAIVAFWGAPLPVTGHANLALHCALACQRALSELNKELQAAGKPELQMRIGINTGLVTVGNIGSKDKIEYTVIGDAVNLASRLEGINKEYGTRIICGAVSASQADDPDLILRRLDRVKVKGKQRPVEIYQVLADSRSQTGTGLDPQRLQCFESALQLYFQGDFAQAGSRFAQLDADEVSRVFLQRCRCLLDNPPTAWDGSYTFTSK